MRLTCISIHLAKSLIHVWFLRSEKASRVNVLVKFGKLARCSLELTKGSTSKFINLLIRFCVLCII